MTFEQLLEEADQQLFNKLCNNSDHCLHSLLTPLSNSVTTLPTAPESTQQRDALKNLAPSGLHASYIDLKTRTGYDILYC